MKVIFFANTAWYLYNFRLAFARYLRERSIEVVMLSPADAYSERLQAEGFRCIRLDMDRRSLHPLRELALLRRISRIYADEKPDLVHHFTVKCVVYGSLAARRAGVRNRVNALVGLGHVFVSQTWRARLLRPAVSALLKLVLAGRHSRLIVQHADDFEVCRRARLAPAGDIRLIRGSGVDTKRFRPRADCPRPAGTCVLFASRLLANKGVFEYVEAAQKLRKLQLPVEFLLAGAPDRGNPSSVPITTVTQWQANGWICYLGHVSDMPALLARVDIAVLPSYGGEGIPRCLIEAAAAGLPIITTDAAGCREVVEDGVTGLLVPVGESTALAEAIRLLHENPQMRARMGKSARTKAVAEFDERIVMEKTYAVYRELVADSSATEAQQVIHA